MTRFPVGTFTPRPGAGSPWRMLAAQSGTELRLAFRNGEQVLLTLLIPMVLLVGLSTLDIVPLPEPRIAAVTPGVLALAVLSTAFTGQAIALGFDRRYGVIRRLAATALPRWLLVAGRFAAVIGVVAIQVVILAVLAVTLGWRPEPAGWGWALLLVLLGCAAFGSLGILLGGTLRAEITLAVANVVWFVLLLAGGIVDPARSAARTAGHDRGAAALRGVGRGTAWRLDRRAGAEWSAGTGAARLDGRGGRARAADGQAALTGRARSLCGSTGQNLVFDGVPATRRPVEPTFGASRDPANPWNPGSDSAPPSSSGQNLRSSGVPATRRPVEPTFDRAQTRQRPPRTHVRCGR